MINLVIDSAIQEIEGKIFNAKIPGDVTGFVLNLTEIGIETANLNNIDYPEDDMETSNEPVGSF